jgi:DNA repair exonuclease SbcCD ATPase subunit
MLIDFLVPVYMAMAGLTAVLLAAVTTLAYRVGRLPTHSDLHRVRDEIRQEVGEQTAALRQDLNRLNRQTAALQQDLNRQTAALQQDLNRQTARLEQEMVRLNSRLETAIHQQDARLDAAMARLDARIDSAVTELRQEMATNRLELLQEFRRSHQQLLLALASHTHADGTPATFTLPPQLAPAGDDDV